MIDTETITRWLHYNALSAAEAVRVLELSGYPLGDAIAIVGDAVLNKGEVDD